MKQDDVIRGYRVVGKPSNTDAGKCLWASARKDDGKFFIKEFLDPRRPRPGFMGGPEARRAIEAQCEEFEQRHRSVNDRIDPKHLNAGNLVIPVDFFAEGSRYYKVTAWVPRTVAGAQELRSLAPFRKGVLLGTLGDSLLYLHSLGIVHGDLKPQNVLVHRPDGSDLHTAKLIDFDDAFPSGLPPEPTSIGGDPRYGAPEWVRYLHGEPGVGPEQLTTAADMFAFGLLVHIYLVGRLPGFDARHGSPAEAVIAGRQLRFDARLDPDLLEVLHQLADVRPDARPCVEAVQELLEQEEKLVLRQVPPRAGTAGRAAGHRPPINHLAPAERPPPGAVEGRPRSRVRINLRGRAPEVEDE